MWLLARPPTPEDLILNVTSSALRLVDAIHTITAASTSGTDQTDADAAAATVDKHLRELKLILIGDAEREHDEDRGARVAAAAVAHHKFADGLLSCMCFLPLETQKNIAHVFANLARRPGGGAFANVVARDATILAFLTNAFKDDNADFALLCGIVLREFARHEVVVLALFDASHFWDFFTDFVRLKNFEVASVAFELLRSLLIGHCTLAAGFVETNYDAFVLHYNQLLQSKNYVTCRESLRLLGEFLLERPNFTTMMKYISDPENLKVLMILLRSKKTRIQIEAFHVFKVFVANPRKPRPVSHILLRNKDKLLNYLQNFHNNKEDDQFVEEKQLMIDTLVLLS